MSMGTTKVSDSTCASSVLKERRIKVPGVGVATQLPNGTVCVKYPNGAQLTVDGKQQVQYRYEDGHVSKFTNNDNIPRPVMEKLQQMPKVLQYLIPQPVSFKTRSIR